MSLFPRNSETLCHMCAARRVDGDTTDALQDTVADWLAQSFQPPMFDDEPERQRAVYLSEATRLLALIARTAKAHRQQQNNQEPPF